MTDTEHAGLRWKAAVRQAMLARPVTSLTNSQRFFYSNYQSGPSRKHFDGSLCCVDKKTGEIIK
jgi:hypothetical protein